MSYFTEVEGYETYAGKEDDFHFIYNANTGGGQSFLGGRFRDGSGNLQAPIILDGLIAQFCFNVVDGNGVAYKAILNDEATSYEIKPRADGSRSMKFGVEGKPTPSDVVAAFLMLPETCGVKRSADVNTSVLNSNNYWLQSMWLDVDTSTEGKAIFKPKDCIISGGIDKQGQGSARYFSIDFAKRFADVISAANNNELDGEVLSCVRHFAAIYKGEKTFVFDESVEAIKAVMKHLSSKYPEKYSGTLDPLMMIRELANLKDATSIKVDCRSDILAAIRAKPFILLAGMSGTGKTRIVRQLARGCCPTDSDLAKDSDHPGNYECIPVRPNWHDSTGLMGYVSRIDGAKYVVTDFVRFLAKAWLYEEEGIPFFLCLDEMNLAPVEQYFAEYLSVIESRRVKDGKIVTDPLVRITDEALLKAAIDVMYKGVKHETAEKFKAFFVSQGGIPIPSNLVVMGTVNMDETTCSFPRKVLDRALTFELNDFDVDSGLESNPDTPLGSIKAENAKGSFTHGWQVYAAAKTDCDRIKPYLAAVNEVLNGTPFKFAYRTRDEVLAYCVERMKDGTALAVALDEATSMKILSCIEGDEQIVKRAWLEKLQSAIADGLKALCSEGEEPPKKCAEKLTEMLKRLVDTGFTSFWA